MLRSDWMPLPALPGTSAFAALTPSLAPTLRMPVAPQAPALSSDAQSYTPLGQDVARDVQQFIAQGSGAAALPSPQASWLALQAARQAARAEKGGLSQVALSGAAQLPSADNGAGLQPAQQAFLDRIGPWAQKAAQHLGVSPRAVMAHAALESGWGQRPLRNAQGQDSLNLFGIKAQGGWQGSSVQAMTTEYEEGAAVKQSQSFRQYADLDATFGDYVRLLGHSPRYQAALRTGEDVQAFAGALATGGYATDPHYAQKLVRISRQIPPP